MKGHSTSGGKAKPVLDQSEWDFSQCPKDELTQCYWYEYARESKNFCSQYEKSREEAKRTNVSGFVTFADGSQLKIDCPEFPQTPWLKIPPAMRKKLLYSVRWTEPAIDFAYDEQPIGFNPSTGEEVVKLEVNWAYSKTQIAAEFQKWVDKFAEVRQKALDPKLTLRQKPMKVVRNRLKALGALRLVKHMSTKDADELTASYSLKDRALYNTPSAWSHAKSEAEKILLSFDPEEKVVR